MLAISIKFMGNRTPKLDDAAGMQIKTMFGIGILILIGSFRCLKEPNTMDMILG